MFPILKIFMQQTALLKWISNESIANTAILIAIVLILRIITLRALTRKQIKLSDTRRRWISIVKNTSIVFILLGLIFIWSPELSTFALSLTAFAVATVLATKEYLLCMVGAIYRVTSQPFNVGDWIEIQGMRGEVIAEGILTTQLQELGTGGLRFEHTGRVLTFPNSILLTQTVYNESFRKRWLHHRFTVTVEPGIDPKAILAGLNKMLDKGNAEADPLAERYWSMVKQRAQTDLPSREPMVSVETSNLGKIAFVIVVFCSTADAADIETRVTAYILEETAKLVKSRGGLK